MSFSLKHGSCKRSSVDVPLIAASAGHFGAIAVAGDLRTCCSNRADMR